MAKVLGHSPATMLRYYTHYVADDADLVRDVVDDLLSVTRSHSERRPPRRG